jgi:hypothetical protein
MSKSGAGIGSGNDFNRQSSVYSVKVTGGLLILEGSGGLNSNSLGLGNSSFDCSAISSTSCLRAQNVTFASGPLIVRTSHSNFAEFSETVISGDPQLWIEYVSTSVRESLVGLPIIHIEELEFPISSIYELYVTPSGEAIPNCTTSFRIDSSQIRGIGFSVPSPGHYTISYTSLSTLETGYLIHDSIDTFEPISGRDSFYSSATFHPAEIHCGPKPTLSAPASPTATDAFTFAMAAIHGMKRIIFRGVVGKFMSVFLTEFF